MNGDGDIIKTLRGIKQRIPILTDMRFQCSKGYLHVFLIEVLRRFQHLFYRISATGPPKCLPWITDFSVSDRLLIPHGERQITIRLNINIHV